MTIAFDATSHSEFSASTTVPLTFSHTVTGNNPFLILGINTDESFVYPTSAPTYNGVPMTLLTPRSESFLSLYMYYLKAPPTGTHNISVSFDGITAMTGSFIAMSFTGVDQTAPIDVNGANGVTANNNDIALTTIVDNDWLLDFILCNSSVDTIAVDQAGQVQKQNINANGRKYGASYRPTTTHGSNSIGWSVSLGDSTDHVAVAVKPAATTTSIPNQIVQVNQAIKRGANW